jgi:acyl-CoA thioesterase-1
MANPGAATAVPVESTTVRPPSGVVEDHTGAPRVLFLGTSLTAGYGLDDPARDSWPSVIQQIADSLHVPLQAVNAGLSGETSAGALRRTDWLLKQKADLVVIETGANDGLRGLDPDSTAANLRAIISKVRGALPGARILLVQMEAPTNLGAGYTRAFHALYARVAKEANVPLSPFLLDGVAGVRSLNQADGIHPLPEGARRAARTMWPSIRSALPAR